MDFRLKQNLSKGIMTVLIIFILLLGFPGPDGFSTFIYGEETPEETKARGDKEWEEDAKKAEELRKYRLEQEEQNRKREQREKEEQQQKEKEQRRKQQQKEEQEKQEKEAAELEEKENNREEQEEKNNDSQEEVEDDYEEHDEEIAYVGPPQPSQGQVLREIKNNYQKTIKTELNRYSQKQIVVIKQGIDDLNRRMLQERDSELADLNALNARSPQIRQRPGFITVLSDFTANIGPRRYNELSPTPHYYIPDYLWKDKGNLAYIAGIADEIIESLLFLYDLSPFQTDIKGKMAISKDCIDVCKIFWRAVKSKKLRKMIVANIKRYCDETFSSHDSNAKYNRGKLIAGILMSVAGSKGLNHFLKTGKLPRNIHKAIKPGKIKIYNLGTRAKIRLKKDIPLKKYHPRNQSKRLFLEDIPSGKKNVTEWRRSLNKKDIPRHKVQFLGEDYVKIGKGKWRSKDGRRQFRVKPADYSGIHGIGKPRVPDTSHLHFELLELDKSGKVFIVKKNIHVPLID